MKVALFEYDNAKAAELCLEPETFEEAAQLLRLTRAKKDVTIRTSFSGKTILTDIRFEMNGKKYNSISNDSK